MWKSLLDLKDSKILVFVIVYLSFLLDNVLLTVVVPIIPDYLFSKDVENSVANRLSLSPIQRKFEQFEKNNGPLGALLASKAFVQLIFTPVVGYLTGKYNYNVPLLIGSCNMLIATILFAYGKSYGVLVLARALHGSSSAAIGVSGMCILANTLPKDYRLRFMPIAFGGIALGVLIGYPLGGVAYQFIGKSAPFLIIAFFIIINILLQVMRLEKSSNTNEEDGVDNVNWIELMKYHKTIIIAASICISTGAMAILEPCIPMWMIAHFDPPPSKWQLGAVFIPDSVGYLIGSNFIGLLSITSWRIALGAMTLIGLCCCAIPLAATISNLTLPHFGLGFGVGAVDAALVPLLANLVDMHKSTKYGPIYTLQQMSVSLAYCFGPLLGGQLVNILGFPWLIRIVGFTNIIFCPFLVYLETTKKKQPLSEEQTLPSYASLSTESCEDWE
ncbi:synaptic vesicular amine transporter [Onthophagus taurus]|uniref:synaptic vesicular amine transporter n=1 Tax=Onthophagus taurus TaxID=166361 RepID=UPI0039BE7C0F